jgi:hypothetical protein
MQGYLGFFLKKMFRFLTKYGLLEIFLVILIIIFYLYMYGKVAYAMGIEDPNKNIPNINVNSDNNAVNIGNLNVPSGVINGLTNVGMGTAVGMGMTAAGKLAKSYPGGPLVKFGTIVAGGAAAALTTLGNSINKISQNSIKDNNIGNSYTSNNNSYGVSNKTETFNNITDKRLIEDINLDIESFNLLDDRLFSNYIDYLNLNNIYYYIEKLEKFFNNYFDLSNIINTNNNNNPVIDILYSNLYLHIILLYLIFNLIIFILYSFGYKYELKFLKILTGEKIYSYILKGIEYGNKYNNY